MKERKEKRLSLNKVTIQDLEPALNRDFVSSLERDEQKTIKGGKGEILSGVTVLPVYCKP